MCVLVCELSWVLLNKFVRMLNRYGSFFDTLRKRTHTHIFVIYSHKYTCINVTMC